MLAHASESEPGQGRGLELEVEWLGELRYADALVIQERALAARRSGERGDRLLLMEHPSVVTLGRSARAENLLLGPAELARRGVELFEARRGGDVTYHAPGQLVGYLVVDLDRPGRRDVHRFLRQIEAGLLAALEDLGVPGRRLEGTTGVFVDDARLDADPAAAPCCPPRKIASIGLGLRGWVTWHGFALNVSLDLAGFDCIVPCGLRDVEMTSVQREQGTRARPDLDERARRAVSSAFSSQRW